MKSKEINITSRDIAATNSITTGDGFYGATTTGAAFCMVSAPTIPAPNQAMAGWGIIVKVDEYTNFLCLAINPNTNALQFNSLQTLAMALNNLGTLNTKFDVDGRLHIAPSSKAYEDALVTFTDSGGGNLVETLGLDNIFED